MEQHEARLKEMLNRNTTFRKNTKNTKRNQRATKTTNKKKSSKNIDKTPIDDSKLSVREMKNTDKYDLLKIVSDFRRDYYINVYKRTFRSWFTYAITGVLLAISINLINSKMSGFCLPPLIVTVFLLWKVNSYKKMNRHLNVNDMEILNQNETIYFKFKTTELRRANQGVLLAYLKDNKQLEEIDVDDINLSDLDTDNSDLEDKINEKNKKLVGYLIYGKQKDELETVCLKEICIDKDFRQRKIASLFLKRACQSVFREYGFRRVTFQLSSFNHEATQACNKHSHLFNKLYSWVAFNFIPGVYDERTVYAFNISQLN